MLRVWHCEKFYIMQSSLTTIDLADMSEQNGPTIWHYQCNELILITCLNACSYLLSDTKFILTCIKRDSKFIFYVKNLSCSIQKRIFGVISINQFKEV